MNTANFLEIRPASAAGVGNGGPLPRSSDCRESESFSNGFAHLLDSKTGGPKRMEAPMECASRETISDERSKDASQEVLSFTDNDYTVPESPEEGSPSDEDLNAVTGLRKKSFNGQESVDSRMLHRTPRAETVVSGTDTGRMSHEHSALSYGEVSRRIPMITHETKRPELVGKAEVAAKPEERRLIGRLAEKPEVPYETKRPEMAGKAEVAVSPIRMNASTGLVGGLQHEKKDPMVRSRQSSPLHPSASPVQRDSDPSAAKVSQRSVPDGGRVGEEPMLAQGARASLFSLKPLVLAKERSMNADKAAKGEGSTRVGNQGGLDTARSERMEILNSGKERPGLETQEKPTITRNLTNQSKGESVDSGADKVLSLKARAEANATPGTSQQASIPKTENGKVASSMATENESPFKSPQSAKTSRGYERNANAGHSVHENERKSEHRAFEGTAESQLGSGRSGIGTARAVFGEESDPSSRVVMTKTVQKSDSKTWVNGMTEPVSVQEPKGNQVVGRVESGQTPSSQSSGMSEQHGRGSGSEAQRHYVQEIAESRSNAQAATQSQFMDRSVASQLSSAVVNQILNHLEKLRESDRGRVRVHLGSSVSDSLAVQISISGGVVHTVFEGDESILRQIRSDWQWIQSRASDRGVSLEQPQYLSSSLVSGGASLFPDDTEPKGNQSQSVIQQSENQPVRPEFQTAVSGNSGPVHLYA